MAKLQRDFLGPFVQCNGAINRPARLSCFDSATVVLVAHVRGTPTVAVRDTGSLEIWHACGSTEAYLEAKRTLPASEFENFALLACGPSLAGPGCRLPLVRQRFPAGFVEYQSAEFIAHMALSRALASQVYARRAASRLAIQAAPAGGFVAIKPVPIRDFI